MKILPLEITVDYQANSKEGTGRSWNRAGLKMY